MGKWSTLPLVRGEPLADYSAAGVARVTLAGIGLLAVYGAAMGSFGGVLGDRAAMVAIAAAKAPLLILVAFVLCLPPFYIVNALLGLGEDFPSVLRALATTQAVAATALAALAPATLFWYASCDDYNWAIRANGATFAAASLAGQVALRRAYRPLIAVRPRHRLALGGWLALYVFVAVQMAWTLRPFIGSPDDPVAFFRPGAFTNAYVELFRGFW